MPNVTLEKSCNCFKDRLKTVSKSYSISKQSTEQAATRNIKTASFHLHLVGQTSYCFISPRFGGIARRDLPSLRNKPFASLILSPRLSAIPSAASLSFRNTRAILYVSPLCLTELNAHLGHFTVRFTATSQREKTVVK